MEAKRRVRCRCGELGKPPKKHPARAQTSAGERHGVMSSKQSVPAWTCRLLARICIMVLPWPRRAGMLARVRHGRAIHGGKVRQQDRGRQGDIASQTRDHLTKGLSCRDDDLRVQEQHNAEQPPPTCEGWRQSEPPQWRLQGDEMASPSSPATPAIAAMWRDTSPTTQPPHAAAPPRGVCVAGRDRQRAR